MNSSKLTLRRLDASISSTSNRISPELAASLLGGFALVVALFGGSSRADPIQIAFLRPLAAMFLIPALYWFSRDASRQIPAILALLFAWTLWTGLQLVPLPPSVWQELPDRKVLAELDRLAGLAGQWRPLSLAPMRGMNALASLIVPITAVLLALAFRSSRRLLLHLVLAMGVLNAGLALAQVLTGPNSALYLYKYISPQAAAGLFANENHSAVFSVLVLLIIARLTTEVEFMVEEDRAWTRIAYPAAFLLVLLMVLVTGSRAGIACLVLALGACGLMVQRANRQKAHLSQKKEKVDFLKGRAWKGIAAIFGLFAFLLISTFFWMERTPALQDVLEKSSFDDLRWDILPILKDMASVHWVWGTGFGSFDAVYQVYEPTDLLFVSYVNQAHNDWIQVVIEGGVPAILICVVALFWIARSVYQLSARRDPAIAAVGVVFWSAVILVLSAASMVDYPLRTPIFQVVTIWLLVCLASDQTEARAA